MAKKSWRYSRWLRWLDGAEIRAVCTLLALDQRDVDVLMMAPDVEQMHVVDHLAGEPEVCRPQRSSRVSASRVARWSTFVL